MNESQQRAWLALGLGPRWRSNRAVSSAAAPAAAGGAECAWGGNAPQCALAPDGPVPGRWLIIVGGATHAPPEADPAGSLSMQLLDQILAALALDRAREVCLLSLPDGAPSPGATSEDGQAERQACRPCLLGQIERVAPRVVVVLGQSAAQAVLGVDAPLQALRGQAHALALAAESVGTVVSHHPADLLGRPGDKAQAWADWCLARRVVRA